MTASPGRHAAPAASLLDEVLHHRCDLVQAALLATDREHLHAEHAVYVVHTELLADRQHVHRQPLRVRKRPAFTAWAVCIAREL